MLLRVPTWLSRTRILHSRLAGWLANDAYQDAYDVAQAKRAEADIAEHGSEPWNEFPALLWQLDALRLLYRYIDARPEDSPVARNALKKQARWLAAQWGLDHAVVMAAIKEQDADD